VTRGVIGIRVDRDAITKDVAQVLGLPNPGGAMLSTVIPGGPADKAGLMPGDVITEFNGRPIADSDALVNMVVGTRPGTAVPVTIYRKKQKKTVNVTVDELDLDAEQGRQSSNRREPVEEPTATGFGMEVGPITPEIARELELQRAEAGQPVFILIWRDRESVFVTLRKR